MARVSETSGAIRGTRSRTPPVIPASSGPARLAMKQVALDMFQERGFRNVSVRDITGALGLTSAAVYAHFRSKEDILYELLLDAHVEIDRLMTVAASLSHDDPVADLAAHTYLLGVFHTEMKELARLGPDFRYLPDPQREHVVEMRRAVIRTFMRIIERGNEIGVFSVEHPRITTTLVLNMTRSMSTFYVAEGAVDHHALAVHNCRLVLRAVMGAEPALPRDLFERLGTAVHQRREVLDRPR